MNSIPYYLFSLKLTTISVFRYFHKNVLFDWCFWTCALHYLCVCILIMISISIVYIIYRNLPSFQTRKTKNVSVRKVFSHINHCIIEDFTFFSSYIAFLILLYLFYTIILYYLFTSFIFHWLSLINVLFCVSIHLF